ncbi:MAG: PVC-type heme-binding CxxCH protein [Planctomycetota bacterium]
MLSIRTLSIFIALLIASPLFSEEVKAVKANAASVGSLSPLESIKTFKTPADLQLDLVLSEPVIAQPLFINFDERGRMWVVEYRQYPQPAGLTIVNKDAVWRSQYDKVPKPPPHHTPGMDRISIHEDTKGNGTYDKHTVFVDGLSIVTAVERGRGGVFVLNPPYLLFYHDKNNDDIPDGPPDVLLEGFGIEDTHSVVNSMRWGPDGWLYAAQGSTVSGHVKRPGAPDKEAVDTLGQQIWRYHPETHRFEVFAEGGGNTFGVELDSKGRIFSGHNGGDTRGFDYVQGGYSQKGFDKHGPLSNPYTFGYFPMMKHDKKVTRFTHTFLTYEGGAFPAHYNGKLFAVDPLRGAIFETEMEAVGSTFQTHDIGEAVTSTDTWFRPVDIKLGPDGAVYIADFYDAHISHLKHRAGMLDTELGRIYRLRAKDSTFSKPVDLGAKSSAELVELLRSENRWTRQTAQRLLADRKDKTIVPKLAQIVSAEKSPFALEACWALYASGGLDEPTAIALLEHENPYVRLWVARLLCDEKKVTTSVVWALTSMAHTEKNVEARSQLACSARRLPAKDSFPIVRELLAHSEDATDGHIPLLLWWAIEAKCATDREAVLNFIGDRTAWDLPLVRDHILERLMRRWAASGSPDELAACASLFGISPNAECNAKLLTGFEKAFEGRTISSLPTALLEALTKAGGDPLPLDLRMGKPGAVDSALTDLKNAKISAKRRVALIQILGEIDAPASVPYLLGVVASSKEVPTLKAALAALQQYNDTSIPGELLKAYTTQTSDMKVSIQLLLASRDAWAIRLLQDVDKGALDRGALSRETLDKLRQHDDASVIALTEKLYGKPRTGVAAVITDEAKAAIATVSAKLKTGGGNPLKGYEIFKQRCAVCHTIYGSGGRVGPDLTSTKRDDTDTMLLSIVSPSAEIREGFEAFLIKTTDGRRLMGLIARQDKQVVVLRGADGQETGLPRDKIAAQKPLGQSLMPEGVLNDLSDEDLRHLFAFLKSTQPPK